MHKLGQDLIIVHVQLYSYYRWFCHFDDDIYVNIPMLVAALQELELSTESNRTTGDDFYFGRWPVEAIRNPKLKNGYPVKIGL